MGKGVVSILQGRTSGARWAARQSLWCQRRSTWHGAAPWCVELGRLSSGLEPACYTLKVVHFTLLGLFNKCFSTPNAKFGICPVAYMGGTWLFCLRLLVASVEFAQESICGWSRSADTAALTCDRYLKCVSLPDMSA